MRSTFDQLNKVIYQLGTHVNKSVNSRVSAVYFDANKTNGSTLITRQTLCIFLEQPV